MHVSSKLKKKPADAAALRKCDESREERREYARRKGDGSVIEMRPNLKYKTKWADILLGTRDACTHRGRIQN